MIAALLVYKGYTVGPDITADAVLVADASGESIAHWSHPTDPQPTTAQLAEWESDPAFADWLAEHGGDPVLTARREARELAADTASPLHPLIRATRHATASMIRAGELSDDDLTVISDLYPPWEVAIAYKIGDLLSHGLHLYECIQAHTSQSDWPPDVVPALFKRHTPAGVIEAWSPRTGAHDAYRLGDRVTHIGKTWESLHDANVWEPGSPGTASLWVEV